MMFSTILLIIAMFASIGFFEKALTASIPNDDVPLQTSGEPINGYDSPNLGFLPSDEDLTKLKSISSSSSPGWDDVNIPPDIDTDELAAAAEPSSLTLMMTDSTPPNPTAKYPKPVCLILLWPLCCHGKLFDRFGKISDCFECMTLLSLLIFPLLPYLSSLFIQSRRRVESKLLRF